MTTRYKVNEDALSHELIDGEVVIIQFDTGNYYSLAGSAATIWQRLVHSASSSDLAALFTAAPPGAESEIAAFVNELVSEGLVHSDPDATLAAPALPASPPGSTYLKPELNKYTDMQQLLLADPLHEVQETGWPHTKPNQA
jgi:hypothetical protein